MWYRPKQRTEESKIDERHLKKCSTSLAIREMQVKATLRFHLTPVKMAKSKTTYDNLCWRVWDKRNIPPFLVRVKIGTAPLDISMTISQKVRKQPTSRPSNTNFGYKPKGCSIISQGHVLNCVHRIIVCHIQKLKTT